MSDKVCIWCKQDCSTKPRQKDNQGRYLCQECVKPFLDAMKPKEAARPAAGGAGGDTIPLEPAAGAASGMGGSMGVLLEEQVSKVADTCPSCARPMSRGAMICTHCGYNTESGRQIRSRIVEQPKPKKGSGAGDAAGKAAAVVANSESMALLFGGIGAVVGGAIGAAAWAFVAYQFGYEHSMVAIGIGFLTGGGAMLGARGFAGMPTGVIAAIVAILSIAAGKYAVVSVVVDEFAGGIVETTQHDYIVDLADRIAMAREGSGETLDWPDGMDVTIAYEVEDYPPDVWQEAQTQWGGMNATERQQLQERVQYERRQTLQLAKEEGFLAMFEPIDAIFFLVAVVVAFGAGAGGNFNE